jgi:ribosome maturation factor RimP
MKLTLNSSWVHAVSITEKGKKTVQKARKVSVLASLSLQIEYRISVKNYFLEV